MRFSKQFIRKSYLRLAGSGIVLFLALLIVLTVIELPKTNEKFLYPYPILINLLPIMMDYITILVLEKTAGSYYLDSVVGINTVAAIVNLIVFSVFVTQYQSCRNFQKHQEEEHMSSYSSSDDMSVMCNIPKNIKFCVGFALIVGLFVIWNFLQIIVIEANKKVNNDHDIDKEKKKRGSYAEKRKNSIDKTPIQEMHVKDFFNTGLDVTLWTVTALSILTACLVNYSRVSLVFIGQIVCFGPAIAAAFGSLYLKRTWFVIGLSTVTSACSCVWFIISILYFTKLCQHPDSTKEFLNDKTCIIGYRSSIAFMVFHLTFSLVGLMRTCLHLFHVMFQSNYQQEYLYKNMNKPSTQETVDQIMEEISKGNKNNRDDFA